MQKLVYESYIAHIINSVGSRAYSQYFVDEDGKQYDVMDSGDKSCAYFVSSILKLFNYSTEYHATITATLDDITKNGWKELDSDMEIPLGSIIVWSENTQSNGHRHIGFYIGENSAVSNSSKYGKIRKHSKNFGGKRNILSIHTYNFKSNI